MRLWTSQSDYTAVHYRGVVPKHVTTTETAIEIPLMPRNTEPQFLNIKDVGSSLPTSELIREIQKAEEVHQQDFLPTADVLGIINRTVRSSALTRVDSVPADTRNWSDPPHIEFVNRSFESANDLKGFVETYGFGSVMVETPVQHSASPTTMRISLERLQQEQDLLRRDWGKTERAQTLKDSFLWSANDIDFVKGKPKIIIRDVWDYITVLFLIDLSAGRLKVCKNPQCKRLKYFVQERRNQKFCSASCKNTWGVYSWLADAENRKRWNADRRKARPKSKASRGGKS